MLVSALFFVSARDDSCATRWSSAVQPLGTRCRSFTILDWIALVALDEDPVRLIVVGSISEVRGESIADAWFCVSRMVSNY